MDFFKSAYTQAEIDEEIHKRLKVHRRLDPFIKQAFHQNEEDIIAEVRSAMPLAKPTVEPPRQLTAEENRRIDNEINARAHVMRIFGDRAESDATGIPAIDEASAASKQAGLEKLLGPARRAKTELQVMIEKAVEEAIGQLRKSSAAPAPPREGIMPRLAAAAAEQDGSSLLTKFLQGYVNGDEQAMRAVARQLAA